VWRRRSRPPAGREVRRSNDAAPVRAVLDEDAKDAASQTTLHPVPSASVRQPAAPAGVPGEPAPASGNIIAGDPAADRPAGSHLARSCAPQAIVARRLKSLQHHSHRFHRGRRPSIRCCPSPRPSGGVAAHRASERQGFGAEPPTASRAQHASGPAIDRGGRGQRYSMRYRLNWSVDVPPAPRRDVRATPAKGGRALGDRDGDVPGR
jgi:hypothetical protein